MAEPKTANKDIFIFSDSQTAVKTLVDRYRPSRRYSPSRLVVWTQRDRGIGDELAMQGTAKQTLKNISVFYIYKMPLKEYMYEWAVL